MQENAVEVGEKFLHFSTCVKVCGMVLHPCLTDVSNRIDSSDRENPDNQHSENEDDNKELDGDLFNSSGSNLTTTNQNNKNNEGALDRNAAAVL